MERSKRISRKAISALLSLLMVFSCFSGLSLTAHAEAKDWTYSITSGGEYTCPATLTDASYISGGTQSNPVIIKINGSVTASRTDLPAFVVKNGYVNIVGTNNASITCNAFVVCSNQMGKSKPNGDAVITVKDVVVNPKNGKSLNYVQYYTSTTKCTGYFENVTFKNWNYALSGALALYTNSKQTLKNCTFENLSGAATGAISISSGADVTMEGCTFTNCTATGASGRYGGGAIEVRSNSKLTLDDCTFQNCTAPCGAVGFEKTATVTLKGNTQITGNTSGNLYLPTDATFKVDEDFTGTVGVTTQTAPTESASVALSSGLADTKSALANNNIVSDNAAYSVKYKNNSLSLIYGKENTGTYADYIPAATDDADALAAKVVKFNGYDWYMVEDNSTSETEGTVTLFAKDTIGSSRFDNSNNVYSGSMVKSYLDKLTAEGGTFADVADAIVSTALEDVTVTGAKLWLLSKDEVITTYKLSTALNKCSNDWWLRTPVTSSYVIYVNGESGSVVNTGNFHMNTYGVRPALQLDLSKVEFNSETNTFALPVKDPVPYMAWDETSKTVKDVEGGCTDYTVVTDSTAAFEDGKWYVVNGEVTVASRITVTGTVNLILCDGAKLNANEGIALTSGKTLNIYGQSNGTGELTARGGEKIAGIGGGNKEHAGNVTIHGGVVYANGGTNGAGIGGGNEGNGGNVTINGGKVYATGGTNGAGIGGGDYANGGIVTVNGGTVDAKTIGNTSATSIGNGRYKSNAGSLIVASTHVAYSSNSPITDENKTSATAVQGSGAAMNIARQHYMLVEEGNLHSHNFTYSANGATITATCNGAGTCSLTDNKVSFTLTAPTSLVYNGTDKKATLEGVAAFNAATGMNVSADDIVYNYKAKSSDSAVVVTETKNAGIYQALYTLQTDFPRPFVGIGFTIAKANPTANDFMFSEPDNLNYNGNNKTATVIPQASVNGMGDATVKYYSDAARTNEVDYAKNAGTYYVGITVNEGDNYNAASAVLYDSSWKFTVAKANPTANDFMFSEPDNLNYNGNNKTATVIPQDGVNGMGNATVKYFSDAARINEVDYAKNAGTYYVGVTVNEGDNYNAASAVLYDSSWKFTVAKANPAYEAPTGLYATYGDTLADVTLPTGWAWVNNTQSVGNIGTNTFKANFTPADTANYNTVSGVDVNVTVGKTAGKTAVISTDTMAYNADSIYIEGVAGQEYVIVPKGTAVTDADWNTSVKPDSERDNWVFFENLKEATEYEIYARTAETETAFASDAVKANVYTTLSSIGYLYDSTLVGASITVEPEPNVEGLTYKWYQDEVTEDGEGAIHHNLTEIPGATGSTYTFRTEDAGKHIAVKIFAGDSEVGDFATDAPVASTAKVIFESSGGSDVETLTDAAYQSKIKAPADPTREGFAFDGWYWDEEFETPFDFEKDVITWTETTLYAKWTPNDYKITSVTGLTGANDNQWTKGTKDGVVITVKVSGEDNSFDHFTGVKLDGKELVKDVDYTVEKGSTVVTLKPATLEKLSVGEHTVTILFNNGEVNTTLTVLAASGGNATSPQTGDNSHLGLWIALMMLSLLGIAASLLFGRKKRVFDR